MTDFASFEASYREHFAFAWRALRRLGVPERDLNDAAQDVFVIVYRKFQEFDFAVPMSSWVYAICLRVASNRRRSAVSRRELLTEPAEPAAENERAKAAHVELQRQAERRALLEQALDAMSIEQRAVFTLFELEGRTGEEIAVILQIAVGTVHSRLRLARQIFRRSVERHSAREHFEFRRTGGER